MADKLPTPVVFVHGLWLHASSWQPWLDLFNERGYKAIAPPWPGDGDTVEESRKHPERIANRGLKEITDHFAEVIKKLDTKPIVIGHSFGGLIAQKLLSENLAVAGVAIDPAMPKGVVYLPPRQLASVLPILTNPTQLHGANSLDKEAFHKVFANAVTQEESDKLHDKWTIPAPGKPLFQVGTANLQPHSEAKLDINAKRGPLLVTGGEKDKTVPEISSKNIYKLYRNAPSKTDYVSFKNRGHSLVIDSGWKEVADYALKWLDAQSL
jgi:non-heme chloroperoxidase